jgi:hypothetical protein
MKFSCLLFSSCSYCCRIVLARDVTAVTVSYFGLADVKATTFTITLPVATKLPVQKDTIAAQETLCQLGWLALTYSR